MKKYPIPPSVAKDLRRVEKGLADVLGAYDGSLRAAAEQTVKAGGKRLRPALVLISGQAGAYDYEQLEPVALCAELLHTATLVHDDVLDGARQRRGMATLNEILGDMEAIAAGNVLLAQSFKVLCGRTEQRVLSRMADTAALLCEGETMQQSALRNTRLTIEVYNKRVCYKTASLFSACCELGAMTSGATAEDTKAIGAYGECLGMAFQVFDDILDLVADESKLGKPVGADLSDGTVTLPLIYSLRADKTGRLKEILENENASASEIAEGIGLTVALGGVDKARQAARSYIEQAHAAVRNLKNRGLRNDLTAIGEFVVDRFN